MFGLCAGCVGDERVKVGRAHTQTQRMQLRYNKTMDALAEVRHSRGAHGGRCRTRIDTRNPNKLRVLPTRNAVRMQLREARDTQAMQPA